MQSKLLDFVPEFHDIANEFPYANDKEFKQMVDSIKAVGLKEPITLYEGKILDGRNRFLACDEANADCYYTEFVGSLEEAREESKRLNLTRRNMSPDQLAVIAYRSPLSIRKAAAHYGIGRDRISRVSALAKQDKAILDDIYKGKVSLAKAITAVKYKLAKQEEIRIAMDSLKEDKPSKLGIDVQARLQMYSGWSVNKLAWELTQRDFSEKIYSGEDELLG